jgi:ribosomal protein S18 acetylase RimI-like enzyme
MQVALVDPARDDLAAIAGFIGARNGDDAHHIGYLGEDADDVAGTLGDLNEGAVFALAREDDGELVGVLGVDWDVAVGRAWLYGPYGRCCDEMYAALSPRIPPGVARELYCAAGNALVVDFAGRHGFGRNSRSVVYELSRERAEALPPAVATALTPELADQFCALYEEIFPGASHKSHIVAGRTRSPLTVVEDGRLLGFVTLRLTPEYGNGELEYIGVAEAARGRGLGRRLLTAAVQEAFRDPRMRSLCLNTSMANAVGQRLYESVGFRPGRTMVSFRAPS